MAIPTQLLTSSRGNYHSPERLLECVRAVDPIGLDPCTSPDNPTKARVWVTKLGIPDGLALPWHQVVRPMELAYVNPPYGRGMIPWADKVAEEANEGVEIITLVPARPDTKWWELITSNSAGVCFKKGRYRFKGMDHAAPFPSAIIYHGHRFDIFKNAFAGEGPCWRLYRG